MSRPFTEAAIERPWRVLAVAAWLILAAAPGLVRLELRTDGAALVPAGAPEIVEDREVRRRFDVRDPIAVVLESPHPDGVYNSATLRRVRDLTAELGRLEGLRPLDIVSLATESGFRHRPGSLLFHTLLEPLPKTPAELEQLRSDLRRIEFYDGILVSHDGRATALLVATPPGIDRVAWVREVRRTVAAVPGDEAVAVLGAPVAESLLGRHILADLGVPESWWWGDAIRGGDKMRGGDTALSGDTVQGGKAADTESDRLGVGMSLVAVALMGIVFLLVFRSLPAALLPLSEIGVCLILVFGLMGWLGVPIYLTTVVLPVILASVGTADEIHVFRRFLELSRDPEASAAAHGGVIRQTLEEMAPPVVRTSVTTAVAFLSFTLSPLAAVRAFGLFTALGVLICMVYTLSVIPACLVLLGPGRWRCARFAASRRPAGLFPWLARLAWRRRRVFLAAAALAVLAAADGVRRLKVQDSWIDGFAPQSAFARSTREFDERFLGSHLLRIAVSIEAPRLRGEVPSEALGSHDLTLPALVVDGATRVLDRLLGSEIRIFQLDRSEAREWPSWIEGARRADDQVVLTMPQQGGSARFWLRPAAGESIGYEIRSQPFTVPATLERIGELESFLAGQPGVGGVLGPARYLTTVRFMQTALRESSDAARALPADSRETRHLWSNYARMRGDERLRQLVDEDYGSALVTVFLERSNYADTERLMDAVYGFARQRLEPHGVRLELAGDVAVSQALIDAVVHTQLLSLGLSLLGILAVTALLGRAWCCGLYSVVSPAFAVAVNFAAMGWLGIPLGVATSMFACMTLGVGVDFAIHLLARWNLVRSQGREGVEAMAAALATTGPAILIDACAVGLGFGVLILSQVPSTARLGLLLMVSVLGCLVATCCLIPAFLARSQTVPRSQKVPRSQTDR